MHSNYNLLELAYLNFCSYFTEKCVVLNNLAIRVPNEEVEVCNLFSRVGIVCPVQQHDGTLTLNITCRSLTRMLHLSELTLNHTISGSS